MIYPGQRPGRVLRFLPPEAEKAWSEARSGHSVAAYTAAKMMCHPGHKGLNDQSRPAYWLQRGTSQDWPSSASA